MVLFRQLLFLILVCFVQRGSSTITKLKGRYANFEGVEVRLAVKEALVVDTIRDMLGEDVASTIILPNSTAVALTYGNLVDTSLFLNDYASESTSYSFDGFLRISVPNLRFQDSDKLFSLPIRDFFVTPKGEFYEPFFNEEVPVSFLDRSDYVGAYVNMTIEDHYFTIDGGKNLKCETNEGDEELLGQFLQEELYISSTGEFSPKVCEVPEFCDNLSEFFTIDIDHSLFVTKREGRTRRLCKGYVIFYISERFGEFALLEDMDLEGITEALYMKTSMWIGLKYRD